MRQIPGVQQQAFTNKKYQYTQRLDDQGNVITKDGLGNNFTGEYRGSVWKDGAETGKIDWANRNPVPSDTGTQTRGYTPISDPTGKDKPGAILLEEEQAANQGGIGGSGNSTGLANDQPLGSIIDDQNRYIRRAGAVLLR